MRYRPLVIALALGLAACQPAPVPAPTPTATPIVVAPSPSPAPTVTPTPMAEPSPSPSPSLLPVSSAKPSSAPSGQPSPLSEASHGDLTFPVGPGPAADRYSLVGARAYAKRTSDTTAFGAIDGRPYTEWAPRASAGDDILLMVDLGDTKSFSHVDILPDAKPDVNCFFNIDVSDDGDTWRTMATAQAAGSNRTPTWGTADFPRTSARYLRIRPTSWGSSWVAIWEIQVRR